jgi:hypothetical protein
MFAADHRQKLFGLFNLFLRGPKRVVAAESGLKARSLSGPQSWG